jgi:protein SCO1/2
MSVLLSRRKVVAGMGLLGLGILSGCDSRGELTYKYGKDLSNQILGCWH